MTNTVDERLSALEKQITAAGVDYYLVPMVDAFQSEYIHESAARLLYVTGFTGSAGLGVCAARGQHTLFVDGRYTLQAANEVNGARIRILNSGEVSFSEWLGTLNAPATIGFDPWLITLSQHEQWQKATRGRDITWRTLPENLVDTVRTDTPVLPNSAPALHPLEYAGKSYEDKRAELLAVLQKQNAQALLVTQPDAVNWLLNIRGGDISFNPLVLGYFLLLQDGTARFYTYPRPWGEDVSQALAAQKVTVADISSIFTGKALPLAPGAQVMVDAATLPYGFKPLIEAAGAELLLAEDPVALPRAIKNPVELAGIRAAHARDGLALSRFLCWLDGEVACGKLPDELGVVATLEQHRARAESYRGPSFATIAGSGPNGAIIHYRADAKSNRRLRMHELLLLDSGGQYPDGTTDVTRTIAIGMVDATVKEAFTRVLKGHIALARAQFPVGTHGSQLDVLARQSLWEAGLDYDHGTGHGVGAYLCVHEGPQRISKRGGGVALKPGMILSNEPGYYREGHYGIRIENLVAVKEVKSASGRPMLGFETLTLAPIDTRLIDAALLTSDEHNWLNQYHRRVYDTHAPQLSPAERNWLEKATRAV